jgi:hypothetical protein
MVASYRVTCEVVARLSPFDIFRPGLALLASVHFYRRAFSGLHLTCSPTLTRMPINMEDFGRPELNVNPRKHNVASAAIPHGDMGFSSELNILAFGLGQSAAY